ncbi:MAG: sigma-70 family RNA polymerase sigma factor, partial [Verrucomicrobiales bacterium]|nr:sigma-70 family RNA polymerase sigma factor [Verrucomicrobiales bacterium]
MNAIELWTGFREGRSEAAFGELVRRYTNLVFSVARRRLPDPDLAKDATQQVFIRLARGCPDLRFDAELVAWLHRTTLHVSIDLWRSETRRRHREQKAFDMSPASESAASWSELAPELDAALDALPDADRQALLLRFFDRRSMRELGEAVGVSEDAAKMRVSRALERLRGLLGARGLACSAAALGAFLDQHSVEAAPADAMSAFDLGRVPAGPALPGIPSGSGGFLALPKAKLAAGLVGTLGIVLVGFLLSRAGKPPVGSDLGALPPGIAAAAISVTQLPGGVRGATNAGVAGEEASQRDPNPRELLQAVAAARLAIPSGTLRVDADTENAREGRRWTNRSSMDVVFEGDRRRFESRGIEYAYRYSPDEAEQDRIRREADALPQEAAVAAGLLDDFEARLVSIHDGTTLMKYRENDGKASRATLEDPSKGSADYNFDPRTLGLSTVVSPRSSVEGCLLLEKAKELRLIGREYLDGAPTWHVRALTPFGDAIDFWVDATNPVRVPKVATRGREAVSTFDPAAPGDPIPRTVVMTENPSRFEYRGRLRVSDVRYGVPVDPKTFTLAGLSMAVGTDVVDVRLHRRIGYWTGKGLSEDLPRPESTPDDALAETGPEAWAATLDSSPASEEGLKAAKAILLNTPDGPLVERAGSVILEHHVHVPALMDLCDGLMRMRHRCSVPVLEGLVAKNPDRDVRGWASLVLATFRLDAAENGENRPETDAAIAAFERVAREFGDVSWRGNRLSNLVAGPLRGLKTTSVGRPAPPLEGATIDGEPLRLSEHRGKVVVVVFWVRSVASDIAEYRKALGDLPADRVVLLGVNGDDDRTAA